MQDTQIRKLNLKYKKVGRVTDVLAFNSGDIAISVETAARNAKIYGTSKTKEILLYIIHGILHLAGYDDLTQKDSKRMQNKQEKVLSEIWNGIT